MWYYKKTETLLIEHNLSKYVKDFHKNGFYKVKNFLEMKRTGLLHSKIKEIVGEEDLDEIYNLIFKRFEKEAYWDIAFLFLLLLSPFFIFILILFS
jgi:hypothetical protein